MSGLLVCASHVATPQSVTPSPDSNFANYNISQSWELGYRFASVGGSDPEYRSQINFGDGIRLLSSSFSLNSKNGQSPWLDQFSLSTEGLGNDPYQAVVLRAIRNRLYRYDMNWRSNTYSNQDLILSQGLNAMNTTRQWQDHEIILFPDSWYRFHLGYGRNENSGAELLPYQPFDDQENRFPLIGNVRETFQDFRAGADFKFHSFAISILRRWEFFKDDSDENGAGASPDASPTSLSTLSSLARSQPFRGYTPSWLLQMSTEHKSFTATGRFSYAATGGNFVFDENAMGTNQFGSPEALETQVFGDGQRRIVTGDISITLFPTDKLTLSTSSSYMEDRMSGNNSFQQFDPVTLQESYLNFQVLGIRMFDTRVSARYQFSRKFSAYAGYGYSSRWVDSSEQQEQPTMPSPPFQASQRNELNDGFAGVNWLPLSTLRIHLEGEIGRNSRPFYPIAEGNLESIAATVRYKHKQFSASAGYNQSYNNNSIVVSAFSSRQRDASLEGAWNLASGLTLQALYDRRHLDTIGGIDFFEGTPAQLENTQSLYISNIDTANLALVFHPLKRLEVFLGYSVIKDEGDGRNSAGTNFLTDVQTFPLTYQSPTGRVSFRVNEKLRLNAAYENYQYAELFGLFGINQNYRAHTGYASAQWSF